jgi:hypothetical protein
LQKTIYYIKENSWLARIAARKLRSPQVAIVVGKTIHLHHTSLSEFLSDEKWLLHELKHLEQFRKHGTLPFVLLYLFESIRSGYRNNKYEIEARAAEHEVSLIMRWQLGDH